MKLRLPQRLKKKAPERRLSVRDKAQPEAPTYRRNRTMTDRSTIPEVSERARVHQLRQLRRKIGWMSAAAAGVILVIVLSLGQFSGSVRLVASGSAQLSAALAADEYESLFDEYYQKHPFERFRFLTNYDQLLGYISHEAPEVAAIRPAGIERLGVSKYELQLRQPVASWTVADTRYYVDAEGITYEKNYFDEPTVAVVDESGAQVQQGASIASSRLLSFVGRAVALSADAHKKVTQITIPAGSMRQLELVGEGMPTVRMTIDRPVERQVADMVAALTHLGEGAVGLQYIDVRAESRAFYR